MVELRTVLVDVDTQFDFVDPQGALFVPAAATVGQRIRQRLAQAVAMRQPILGSVDSHAWDAWEFADNGGPFAAHCVKGSRGWLRVHPEIPAKTRFVPMQSLHEGAVANLVGESQQGGGCRVLDAVALAQEALAGVGVYFEKEVYSLFDNPAAEVVVAQLCQALGGPQLVTFDVLGYCTGGYCVDAAASGLAQRGYRVAVLADATAAIGGETGQALSRERLTAAGVTWQVG